MVLPPLKTGPSMRACGRGKRVMLFARLDRDPAQIRELVDPSHASEAAIAAVLHPAERHLRLVVNGWAVDVAHAGFDAASDFQRARDVAREDGSREPVLAVVRHADGLLDIAHAHDAYDRTEGLLTVDAHVARDAIKYRCRHDRALPPAATQ